MTGILVIGGNSRLGNAIISLDPTAISGIARNTGERCNGLVAIDRYDRIPPSAFQGFSTVINCVGSAVGSQQELENINVETPLAIARSAAQGGAERFIHVSSFSVFGQAEFIGRDQPTQPSNAYGRSKVLAEQRLAQDMSPNVALTILRLPMLYGYGRSKLDDLLGMWKKLGIFPVPYGDIKRSMLHYDLAARFILTLADTGRAGTYAAADPEPFSYGLAARPCPDGQVLRTLPIAAPIAALLKPLSSNLHASLFKSSFLGTEANDLERSGLPSRLQTDIADILGACR